MSFIKIPIGTQFSQAPSYDDVMNGRPANSGNNSSPFAQELNYEDEQAIRAYFGIPPISEPVPKTPPPSYGNDKTAPTINKRHQPTTERPQQRNKLQQRIHSYHDENDTAKASDKPKIGQLKTRIAHLLQEKIGTGKDKSFRIVQWLPDNSATNLENICQSILSLCSDKDAARVLKAALHFNGLQPTETETERLQIRAAILFSLSWTNINSPIHKYTNHLEEVSDMLKGAYSFFDNKYSQDAKQQEYNNHRLTAQLIDLENDHLIPMLASPSLDKNMEEKINMMMWMKRTILNMI